MKTFWRYMIQICLTDLHKLYICDVILTGNEYSLYFMYYRVLFVVVFNALICLLQISFVRFSFCSKNNFAQFNFKRLRSCSFRFFKLSIRDVVDLLCHLSKWPQIFFFFFKVISLMTLDVKVLHEKQTQWPQSETKQKEVHCKLNLINCNNVVTSTFEQFVGVPSHQQLYSNSHCF